MISSSFMYRGGLKKWVPKKTGGDIIGQRGRDGRNRNPGCVRAQDGFRMEIRNDQAEQVVFQFQVFNDRFHHPVRFRQPIEVVLDIAGRDQFGVFGYVKGSRAGFQGAFQSVSGQPVAEFRAFRCRGFLSVIRCPVRDDIQEHSANARISQVGGDGRPHDTGADHSGGFDFDHPLPP